MEDFDKFYTVEYFGTKGWEVIWFGLGLTEAINTFRDQVVNTTGQYRLTTPAV